jgi:hypothetical protein
MTAIEKKVQELGLLLCKELVKHQATTGDIGASWEDLVYNNGDIAQQLYTIVATNFEAEEAAYQKRMDVKKKLFPNAY